MTTTLVATRIAISAPERRDLYEESVFELRGLSDIKLMLNADRPDEARRFGRRFQLVLRLLDDLGWDHSDARERYPLTMDPPDLREVLGYYAAVNCEACDFNANELADLDADRHMSPAERATWRHEHERLLARDARVMTLCQSLLDRLDSEPAIVAGGES
jgi:hypothetical protein